MNSDLLSNLDKIHSTTMGIERVRKNLGLDTADIIAWCIEKIKCADDIIRKGKNWYVKADDAVITINAHSYTVITAHKYRAPL